MTQTKQGLGRYMVFWPAAAFLIGAIVAGARADTVLTSHETRLTAVERVAVQNAERLARVEQMVADTQAGVHRIERRMDREPR